jgi:argininosuccinate lyase
LGSLAHIHMLCNVGLLEQSEFESLKTALIGLYNKSVSTGITISPEVEDIHSFVELFLTESVGPAGKKIHIGRSRNDQILVDLKMYIREQIKNITDDVAVLFDTFINLSEKYKDVRLPGYTHMQVAMPSSFGLWFGAYAESLVDDLTVLQAAYKVVNKNPLGSAAGYGSSFPLDRKITTKLLGFDTLNYNSVYAQMTRGKTERIVAQAISSIAASLSKLSMDCILYMGQNFNFIYFPDSLTTGSSIMPHKKNPDVLEIIRARCNRLMILANEIIMITNNLTSGYHRDVQMIKEHFLPALTDIQECLQMTKYMMDQIKINNNILDNPVYEGIYSVEAVQELTKQGMPFRDAYRQVAEQIERGEIKQPENIDYSHAGSMGNLCNAEIRKMMDSVLANFNFADYKSALKKLLLK